jgi:cell division protein FtsQ
VLLAALVALAAAVVFGSVLLLRSALFAATEIRVTGVSLLTESQVTTLAAIPPTSTVPLLSTKRVEERVRKNAWVRSVQVSRGLPHRVTIAVTERRPAALITGDDKRLWVISQDAVCLGSLETTTGVVQGSNAGDAVMLTEQQRAALAPITEVENFQTAPGKVVNNTAVKNALAILKGLSPELREQVLSLAAPSVVGTSLQLKDDIEVDIGSASQIADKDTIIRSILSEQAGKVMLINVRAVDKPIWRGLEGPD